MVLLLLLTLLQTPADTTFYSVAYVDIAPASRTAAITALKQYREASRKEEGFVRAEFFEQVGRPGHLCIIETWSNAKIFDMHLAAAHTKDFRTKLDSIRISDVDQRPYKTLSLSAPPNSTA